VGAKLLHGSGQHQTQARGGLEREEEKETEGGCVCGGEERSAGPGSGKRPAARWQESTGGAEVSSRRSRHTHRRGGENANKSKDAGDAWMMHSRHSNWRGVAAAQAEPSDSGACLLSTQPHQSGLGYSLVMDGFVIAWRLGAAAASWPACTAGCRGGVRCVQRVQAAAAARGRQGCVWVCSPRGDGASGSSRVVGCLQGGARGKTELW
jgi:hypothetical protein